MAGVALDGGTRPVWPGNDIFYVENNSIMVATVTTEPGLVHHSDQGVQYASNTYVDTLNKTGINISMSRRGNPYDNAKAESFIKTLKYEEVYLYEYESLEEAKFRIGYFIDTLYNQKRLHSSLDYRPPAEFEQELADQITVASLIVSFWGALQFSVYIGLC